MLRLTFIAVIVVVGTFYALLSPFYGLLFYLWNAYFRPEEWLWWINLRVFHLSWIIGVYVVFRTLFSAPNPRINVRTLLILLFLVQAVIGTITSEHPIASTSYLQDFFKVLLISYLIVVLVTDRHRFRITLTVIVLSLGFECAKQGWVSLFVAPGAQNNNPIAFLGDNNGVALGTMMLVPITIALARTATRRWEKHAYQFVAIGVFLRGFTTYSRGGFVAAGVLALFAVARSERKVRTLVGVLAIAGLVWGVMPQHYWNRIQTITTSEDEMDASAAGRLHFWRVAGDMVRAKPLTGVGLDGFKASYTAYNRGGGAFPGQRQTHSTWFGVAAELGVPGFLFFIANLGLALGACWRVARTTAPDERDLRVYANALLTSLCVFIAGGTFLSSQYNEMLWHFVGLSTALSVVAFGEATAAEPFAAGARAERPYAVAR